MKTKKWFILFLIPMLLGVSSCKKTFLEQVPVTAIAAESALTDAAKVEAFLVGLYDMATFYYYTPTLLMNADVRGNDLFLIPSGNYGRFVEGYSWVLVSNYYMADDMWEYPFAIIASCAQATSIVPDSEAFTDAEKATILAEVRANRAAAYLNMIQVYAHPYSVDPNGLGVPLVTEPVNPTDEFPARATVAQIYDLIVSDLEYALANLPASKTDIMRVTPSMINGLLARAHLHMENWATARDYAIAARAGHPLGSAASLLDGFIDPTSEWIWAQDMRADDNNGYLMLPSFYDTRSLGYSSFRATPEFRAIFETGDIRASHFGPIKTGGYSIEKYLHRSAWDSDLVLMRSAEMYLIEAECEAHIAGNETNAIAALNLIQARAGATLTIAGTTGQALLNEIAIERRKELFGEGFHLFDMQRRHEPLVRTDAAHWAPINVPANDEKFLFPIPLKEMDSNSNMVQNPAYI